MYFIHFIIFLVYKSLHNCLQKLYIHILPETLIMADKKKEGDNKGITGLFKSKDDVVTGSAGELGALSDSVNDLSRRLRVIEERYTGLRKKSMMTEQHMLSNHKRVSTEVKTLTSDINEIRKQIDDLNDHMLQIIKELEKSARKEDVKVLERYLYFWKPINFVTRQEAVRIVNEILEEKERKL